MLHWTTYVYTNFYTTFTYVLTLCLHCQLLVPLQIAQGYPHEAPKVKCETKVRTVSGECFSVFF